jgi:hypothetical protein
VTIGLANFPAISRLSPTFVPLQREKILHLLLAIEIIINLFDFSVISRWRRVDFFPSCLSPCLSRLFLAKLRRRALIICVAKQSIASTIGFLSGAKEPDEEDGGTALSRSPFLFH